MKEETRNYGIDLLRVLAMFFVLILHSLGQGGILKTAIVGHNGYKIAWLLEIIAYCAVDLFALISGYVSYNRKTKTKNYINLWFQVVFYSLLITGLFNIFYPNLVNGNDYLKSFFPVSGNLYWYFTAYTGLFLIKPLLDKGIINADNSYLKKLFIIIIVGFSIYDTFVNRFELNGGYSFIWLVLLYILGAIIHKCEIGKNIKFNKSLIYISILVLITWIVRINQLDTVVFLKDNFDITVNNNLLVNYTSPTIIGIAILLIIGFTKLNYSSKQKMFITFTSSSAFSIYLLNTHYLYWDNNMLDRFKSIANNGAIEIIIKTISFSIIFLVCAILIDKVRIYVFKKIKIDSLSEKISIRLEQIMNKISI